MQLTLRIKNIDEIRRAFNKAPALMAKNLNTAIHKATLTVGRDSRILTPVDTGRLRASTREVFRPLEGEITTNVNYDIFVHEGTRYMKGRPFLRNALEKNESAIQRLFVNAVQDTLDTVARETR